MYWLAPIIVFIILIFTESKINKTIIKSFVGVLIAVVLTGIVVAVNFAAKTTDTEVWSGRVVSWDHKEEWDEWHPPTTSCTTTDGKQHCTTKAGYYEHHSAENRIKTTDNGWVDVSKAPDGKKFNDRWPNDESVLKAYWPEGTPTASTHSYTNKVQASYSIYKHKDINLKDFKGLPKYPSKTTDYFNVDRIIGDVPNKAEALKVLADKNSELNKSVPNPDKPGKTMSWKQVNIIFVNLGIDKTQDWGYALQDHWGGGNKNDFVVSYSTDVNGKVIWTYAFSWSEVEVLKLEVQDYMNSLEKIDDFVPIINNVGDMVADKFVRKQFADFSYLSIDMSTFAVVIVWILNTAVAGLGIYLIMQEGTPSSNRSSGWSREAKRRAVRAWR